MNLPAIESFCLVVKLGSISKAAKELHISQPALSLQIQELESQLDAILLERSNRGVTATEVGLLVNEYGLKLSAIANNLIKEIEQINNNQTELTVATSSTVGQYALPCTLYIFCERFPDSKVITKILSTSEAIELTLNGGADFSILEGPLSDEYKQTLKNEGITIQRIARDELIVIAPYNEKWMDVEEISINDFMNLDWILRESGSGIRSTIDTKLSQEGINPNQLKIVMELDQTSAIISSVTSERGLSILPRLAVKKELHYKSLKAIRIKEFLFYHTISLAYNPKKIKSDIANEFLQLICSKERGFC
jgi:DNA-binding transcriptional LysR family regulator